MSTTISRSQAAPAVTATVNPAVVANAARRRGRRLGMTLGGVALAAVVLTLGMRNLSGRTALDASELFTVTRRSFPVLLREKGELKAAKSVDIKSNVEGRSTIIWLIEEGSQVEEGELLVRLASDRIEEKIRNEEIKEANGIAAVAAAENEYEILVDQNASDQRKAELSLRMAVIEKQKYLEGDWQQSLLDMGLELDRAQMVLTRSREQLADSEDLHAKEFITEADLWRDRISAFEADIAVKKAKLMKEISLQYTHPKELEQRESDVSEGQKELERVKKSNIAKESKARAELKAKQAELAVVTERLEKSKKQRADCEIRAPQAGLVVYQAGRGHFDNRQVAEGAEVHERQTIINLPDPRVMVVEVRIHEANTDKIALGQQVWVTVEGLPGAVFSGKVTKIAPLADSQNRWLNPELKEYETEITLDDTDERLKPGVTARADIVVTQMQNVVAVPVQAVFTKGGHHFVFRKGRGDPEPVEVQVGMSSDEFAEIREGLQEGDRVLLAVSDVLRQSLPEADDKDRSSQDRGMAATGSYKRPGKKRPPGAAGQVRPAGKKSKGASADHAKQRGA